MMVTTEVGIVLSGMIIGMMLFFSFVIAPTVFAKLPAPTSGRFIRELFPFYYTILGLTTVLAASLLAAQQPLEATLLALVAVAFAVARCYLMPRINRYRDRQLAGDSEAGRPFRRAHRISVALNGLQLVTIVVVIIRLV